MTLKPTVSHSWSEGLASSPLLFRETPFRVASSDVLPAHVERRSHRDEVFAERRHGRGAEAVTDALDRTRRRRRHCGQSCGESCGESTHEQALEGVQRTVLPQAPFHLRRGRFQGKNAVRAHAVTAMPKRAHATPSRRPRSGAGRPIEQPREPRDAEELTERRARNGGSMPELRRGMEREEVPQPLLGSLVDLTRYDELTAALGLEPTDGAAPHGAARDDGARFGDEPGRGPASHEQNLAVSDGQTEQLTGSSEPPQADDGGDGEQREMHPEGCYADEGADLPASARLVDPVARGARAPALATHEVGELRADLGIVARSARQRHRIRERSATTAPPVVQRAEHEPASERYGELPR